MELLWLYLLLVSTTFGFRITNQTKSSCVLNIDDASQWPPKPPIFTDENGGLVVPEGVTGDRQFTIPGGQVMMLGCPETHFTEWDQEQLLYGECLGGDSWRVWTDSGSEWIEESALGLYGCSRQPDEVTAVIGKCGPGNVGTEIQVEFDITAAQEGEALTISVCHDLEASRTLWARHMLWDEISARDTGGSRPSFKPDDFFQYDVNYFYKMDTQHDTIADLVGSEELADQYIQAQNTNIFLSRGHLAPNGDFVFHSWKDSSFHFINVAPQWQSFNGGNWYYLEDAGRNFVMERGIDLVVYTGTHGVIQLADINGEMVDIHLYNGNQLPVPRYFWKIFHDPKAGSGVAVIGINNPHLSMVPEDFIVCPPLSKHPFFDSIHEPTDIKKGYSWACRVEDLSAAFPEVPDLPPMTLLE